MMRIKINKMANKQNYKYKNNTRIDNLREKNSWFNITYYIIEMILYVQWTCLNTRKNTSM